MRLIQITIILNVLVSSVKPGMADLASGSHGLPTSDASLKLDVEFPEGKDQQHFQIYI